MLVCSVVLRPPRGTLAATVSEAASASDNLSPGAVFAILADDNASATDTLAGFVGQIMVEAAGAADVVNAGQLRNAAIVEETIALASVRLPGPVAASITEAATAGSTQDTASAAATAVLEGVFVDPQAPSTLLGTDAPDSGPVTVFD